ncbi:MFS transporter [Nocardioides sp. GCM10027113]|uniref:MFS transporter n=1 Tax=unclassified Nocardioides TaxID=2615069 RepID=UPI003610F29C
MAVPAWVSSRRRRPGAGGTKLLLGLAALAVAFAAADTYVVVLALPEMMAASGLSGEDLQRGAPIISGFLLGYVAVLPLAGRLSDLRGRIPVLVGSLVLFSLGSLVTAAAYDLTFVVTGRVLQGLGAGGLLPATLALVADLYPPRDRGIPLGVVGAVQEFGNVVGPLYGAAVLAVGSWRDIFLINLAAGLALAALLRHRARTEGHPVPSLGRPDWLGWSLAVVAVAAVLLVMRQPGRLREDLLLGAAFTPLVGGGRWTSPLALAAAVAVLLLVARCVWARDPLLDLRAWGRVLAQVDVLGASLLTVGLGGVILAFGTADAREGVLAPGGPWLLVASALALTAFWRRSRSVPHPLLPVGTLSATPAWGALVVSFFVGAGLIAALVDIPVCARLVLRGETQLTAALVLVRFLIGLPVGAFLGGWLTRRFAAGGVTALGMALAGGGFAWMSTWGVTALESPVATVPLFAAGAGIGLAMAPVNAALLAASDDAVHGVASGLLVAARTVGKLVGISVLTAVGLSRLYAAQRGLPGPREVCADGASRCAEYTALLRDAGLTQVQTIFLGAAVCCVIAGLVALVVFRDAETRHVRPTTLGL